MSTALVLRDFATELGLGLGPTRDLALWAAGAAGDLGALGRMAVADGVRSRPPVRPRQHSKSWSGAKVWYGAQSSSACGVGRSWSPPLSCFWSRAKPNAGTSIVGQTGSFNEAESGPRGHYVGTWSCARSGEVA